MRKDQIAETIIALFTSQERAASLVGDLIEDTPARGDLWFWGCVLRTAFALLWHDFTAEPAFLTRLAFRGTLFGLALMAIASVVVFAGVVLFAIVFVPLRGAIGPLPAWVPVEAGAQFLSQLLTLVAIAAIQFKTGQWLARRAPGREMAACMACQLLNLFLWSVVESLVLARYGARLGAIERSTGPDAVTWALDSLGSYGAIFAGAIRVRRRSVSA